MYYTFPMSFSPGVQENDAKALAEKVAAKKARDEAIARGELPPETAEPKRGHGGGAVKASAKKK